MRKCFTFMTIAMVTLLAWMWLLLDWCSADPPRIPIDPVKVSAHRKKPEADGKQVVTLKMQIAKGCYIFANPVEREELNGGQTVVVVDGIESNRVEIRYPAGRRIKNAEIGSYSIYEGDVEIPVILQRGAEDSEAIQIRVRFQAMHASGAGPCYHPKTVKFRLP